MTIWEAYDRYNIMPNLRLHQLRVAAVARELALALKADHELVTKAALLHDMGNIMKSDLKVFPPDFYGDEGIEYWEKVKAECGEKYGKDEHEATEAIVREMGLSEDVITVIGSMGFGRIDAIRASDNLELKICEYADQRVAPYGITQVYERLEEGRHRYELKTGMPTDFGSDTYRERLSQSIGLEQDLFSGLMITPVMLNEATLKGTIESLKAYEIV